MRSISADRFRNLTMAEPAPWTNRSPTPSSTSSRASSRPTPCRRTAWTSRCSTASSRDRQRPESIQPSEWLPQVWSDGGRTANPAYRNNDQAQRIMALMLRHMVGIQRTLAESPTRFKPLLYMPDEKSAQRQDAARGSAWCEGYMAGVKLRDDEWQPLYDAQDARDWIFPIEALAFGDQDPEFAEWIDDKEKRASLVDELPVASVLIFRFWQERARVGDARSGGSRPRAARSRAQVAPAPALIRRRARRAVSRPRSSIAVGIAHVEARERPRRARCASPGRARSRTPHAVTCGHRRAAARA
jgi:yecA family protein